MIKEIKYIMYLVTIFIFFFMSGKYYFSDEFNKKFYRTLNNHQSKIDKFSKEFFEFTKDSSSLELNNGVLLLKLIWLSSIVKLVSELLLKVT